MRQCALCGKSHIRGRSRNKLRGHYNPTDWKQKKANLQYVRLPESGKRVRACTRCIKKLGTKASAHSAHKR